MNAAALVQMQIDFATDTIVSPENEYEILQLMMADLRDRCMGCRAATWANAVTRIPTATPAGWGVYAAVCVMLQVTGICVRVR